MAPPGKRSNTKIQSQDSGGLPRHVANNQVLILADKDTPS
jgi:hypothetical protein